MELDKDLPFLKFIDLYLNGDYKELEISFSGKDLTFTEAEFNNFINTFRNLKYKETIEKEKVKSYTLNEMVIVNGLSNIVKYCSSSDSFDDKYCKFYKYSSLDFDGICDIFDVDFNLTLKNYNDVFEFQAENWENVRKKYCFQKDFIYSKNNIDYIASLFKTTESNEEFYSLKQSNVLKAPQQYSFKIIIKEKMEKSAIMQAIIRAIQSITMADSLLTKTEQKSILDQYYNMIKNDVEINSYNKRHQVVPLITPKPVTLERVNLVDPREYGSVSILEGYTVTEKADGERILMYVNNAGNVYFINNTYKIQDTGLRVSSKLGHNSLIDGEFVHCNKRLDNSNNSLFAAFDMYYINNKNITSLPLIDDKESRYMHLQNFAKMIKPLSNTSVEFLVKEHQHSDNILENCKNILNGTNKYPYEIDGLIFTPSKLALYSYYSNQPVKLTDNVKWDRVFKWKPNEQNTIDFLIKNNRVIRKNGIKYNEIQLFVGYNSSQWEDIDIITGLKLRYDSVFSKQKNICRDTYEAVLFKPRIFYEKGIECALVKQNSSGEIRAENGDKLENNSIVEFRYINDTTIPVSERWVPIRVREDKTRIYQKGVLSKTANDLGVALNIWRSIHNPVTTAMITNNESLTKKDTDDEKLLESDDIYYSRNIPRDYLLSVHMLNFHNQGIKNKLYDMAENKGSLLELGCGEGGDMNRWLDSGYKFVLGIDYVKHNIYNPKSGAYSRMLKKRMQHIKKHKLDDNKIYFPDFVFAAGDCSASIRNGTASSIIEDEDSKKLLQKIFSKSNAGEEKHFRYIAGKGVHGFDAISCMFAIHYFFESEEKLDGFLLNVSQNLKKDGIFFCTFMNGDKVENEIKKNGGDMIEGIKNKQNQNGMPVWAIIRRFEKNNDNHYGKKIDVYIENTQKFIPEYIVSFDKLIEKALQYDLKLSKTEMFEQTFNNIKNEIPSNTTNLTKFQESIFNLDKDDVQKQFSFLNQWAVFKKI